MATGVLIAIPARASFHEIRITEIFPGTNDIPEAQFVELQMFSAGQNQVQGQQLIIYDNSGAVIETFTMARNLPNGTSQSHILIASAEAEDMFGVTGDFQMSDEMAPDGGKICYGTPSLIVDCASWGGYFGQDAPDGGQTGTPFNASGGGLVKGQSMARRITGGTNGAGLDAGDDTNDSAADFEFATPSPQNNGTAHTSPSPTASNPGVVDHDRVVSLTLSGKLKAAGDVEVEDDFAGCLNQAPVTIQRKKGRKFKNVKSTRTDATGHYSVGIPNKRGTYRAKAKAFPATSTDNCVGVNSKAVHH